MFFKVEFSPKRIVLRDVQVSKNKFQIHDAICLIQVLENVLSGIGWNKCHASVKRALKKFPQPILCCCGHCVNEHVRVIVKEVIKVWVWKVLHPAVDAAEDSFLKYVVWS